MAETEKTNATVSKFERMSVEELEEAIRIYLQANDLEENTEDLLLAAEVLDRKKEAAGDHVDTDAHWDRFQRDYLPLLDEKTSDEGDAEKANISIIKMSEKAPDSCDTGNKHMAKRVFRVVAVAALIALVLGLTACAVIPQLRTCVVNFMINTFGSHSVVSVDTGADELNPFSKAETYELNGYMFKVSSEYELDSVVERPQYSYCFFEKSNSTITVYVNSSNFSPIQLDTEETTTTSIIINGKEGFIITKGNKKYVTWGDLENEKIVFICGENDDEEILLNIADTFFPLE